MSTSTYLRSLVPWPFPRLSFCMNFASMSCTQERVRQTPTHPHIHTAGIGCHSRDRRCKNSCGSQVPPEAPIRGEFGGGSFVGESACQDLVCLLVYTFFCSSFGGEDTRGNLGESD